MGHYQVSPIYTEPRFYIITFFGQIGTGKLCHSLVIM